MPARLFLLPGLGADERLFARLGALCLPVVTPRLPPAEPAETFIRYSLRIAADLDLRPEDWIGGCSFGSLVAADIARRRPVAGLVLIGGALDANALAAPIRILARLSALLPGSWLHPLLARPQILQAMFGKLDAEALATVVAMARATPVAALRTGIRLLAGYRPRIPVLCPVHAIHGDRDRVLRAPPVPACRLIAGAGHAIALTHAREVTAFLADTVCHGRAAR